MEQNCLAIKRHIWTSEFKMMSAVHLYLTAIYHQNEIRVLCKKHKKITTIAWVPKLPFFRKQLQLIHFWNKVDINEVILTYLLRTHPKKNDKMFSVGREKKQFCNSFVTFLGENTALNQKEIIHTKDTLDSDMITKDTFIPCSQ